ncbi:hypothetical protein DICVIV_02716 [Dictyocaulus viviparus]|uniref:Uncharacterized protein n=1 Tax=Dictyocaulus viviparus TaxID=29172 RepID=A0A0D8Y365_DICVI|nr:hypothetical protein DICVIV_02716 [Dictyocaulus viviparus]
MGQTSKGEENEQKEEILDETIDFSLRFKYSSIFKEAFYFSKAVDDFLSESHAVLNDAIETGRNLANSGRMELDTHCAIEKLDEIVAIADQLEIEVESQKSALDLLLAQAEALDKDREMAEDVVDSLMSRNLDDQAIANATRQDLADRDSQFAALSQRAAKIHAALPGKSSSSRDTTLAALGDKLSRLESMLIAKHIAPSRTTNATPIRTSPDRTSMSSTGPLVEEKHLSYVVYLKLDLNFTVEIDFRLYTKLDQIEEAIDLEKQYPMENIDDHEERHKV